MSNIFPNSMEKLRDDGKDGGVDVITRTKNRPVLLMRALNSVINQTHGDWHIYLINDGGAPGPVEEVVAGFGARLGDRITVIHNEASLGMSAAANAGMARGSGSFIAIHDDDDSWDSRFLEVATGFLRMHENRRFGGFLSKWHAIEESFDGKSVELLNAVVKGYTGEIVDFLDVLRKPEIPPIALVWRRSVCRKAGFLNEDMPVLDDWDLNLRALQIADIATSSEVLANHHVRRQSAGTYGNSVTQGLPTHFRYNTLYRNSLMREYLKHNPEQIGLVAGLLRNAEAVRSNLSDFAIASHQQLAARQDQLGKRMDSIDAEIRSVKTLLEKIHGFLEDGKSS